MVVSLLYFKSVSIMVVKILDEAKEALKDTIKVINALAYANINHFAFDIRKTIYLISESYY